ncbi:glutathione S-transferase family protein [Conexibacter sp. DBS9H8]|uniref:glutathione S-transferase family protein n=1 Tax=Conexibacter sp. DBS9H8 TaxID=2937801 RepID=UPI00200C51E3|nr:glutathione S-transferase family protein [Conexibacter sp. DBS9H8]
MLAMRLYNSMVSGNCYKVRLVCAQLGLDLELHELDVVDRSNRPEVIGALNPALRVPTLVLDDGRPLAESNAIIDFLADGTPLLPDDPYDRARVLAWQFFEQYEIEPNLAVVRFYAIFGLTAPPGLVEARTSAGVRALQALERGLDDRRFLIADRYSVADVSLYAYVHVAGEGGFDLTGFPNVEAWLARVAEQPGHIPITQA